MVHINLDHRIHTPASQYLHTMHYDFHTHIDHNTYTPLHHGIHTHLPHAILTHLDHGVNKRQHGDGGLVHHLLCPQGQERRVKARKVQNCHHRKSLHVQEYG